MQIASFPVREEARGHLRITQSYVFEIDRYRLSDIYISYTFQERAFAVLRSRLYEARRQAVAAKRAALRSNQVGSGDRSERVRTYNYQQSRVTDHRINYSVHSVDQFLQGPLLVEMIGKLREADRLARLEEVVANSAGG